MSEAMRLPKWLDNLIFNELGAKYYPRYADMTNVDDDKEKTLNYLGTYFPRSFAEAYCIFNDFFKKHSFDYKDKTEFSVFDFGCGTGGEIVGLLTALNEHFPSLKKVHIVALDGNQFALSIYDKIITELSTKLKFKIDNHDAAVMIDDFYDLSILDSVLKKRYDIVISFKAICEFVTKQQFENKNPYEHIAKFLLPKINKGGLLLIEDVTTYNGTADEWLPMMMDKGLLAANCSIVSRNNGFNQIYLITHSRRQDDRSKVAWRMIK